MRRATLNTPSTYASLCLSPAAGADPEAGPDPELQQQNKYEADLNQTLCFILNYGDFSLYSAIISSLKHLIKDMLLLLILPARDMSA